MKNFLLNNRQVVIAAIVLSVFVVIGYTLFNWSENQSENRSEKTSNNSIANKNNEPSAPQDSADAADDQNKTLPKPTLNKSSGNNGPIPSGILVNFTCTGVINAECQIILTDTDSEEVLELEKKELEDTGRGNPSAVWTWKSISGNWQVKAVVTANGFNDNMSNSQELTVQ